MNRDDYLDQDGMLEAILAHERERRYKRRQNNDGIRNAETIGLSLKRFVHMKLNNVKKYLQKQRSEVLHKKSVLKKFDKIHKKTSASGFLLQKRLRHKCFFCGFCKNFKSTYF